MFGSGYVSGTVTPHDTSGFFTMWREEAQGLLDRLMIPSLSKAVTSAFAAASFWVSSQRNGEVMGGPLVSK